MRREDGLWIHRKGVQPLYDGQIGVIPSSMAGPTVHVVGRNTAASIGGVSHGCGRLRSRGESRDRTGRRDVLRELSDVAYDPRLSEALRDETPSAYRNLRTVLRAQRDLLKRVRTLRTLASVKGK